MGLGLLLVGLGLPALIQAVRALPAAHLPPDAPPAVVRAAAAAADARTRGMLLSPLDPTAARAALREALADRPRDAHAWARLAWLDLTIGDGRAAAEAVVRSMQAAPTDRPLLFARLPLAAAAWDQVTPAARGVVLDQVRLAWDVDRRRTRAALAPPQGLRLLAAALSPAPAGPRAAGAAPGSAD